MIEPEQNNERYKLNLGLSLMGCLEVHEGEWQYQAQ